MVHNVRLSANNVNNAKHINIIEKTFTEKVVHLFLNLLLYYGMSGQQIKSPRDPSGSGVVTLRIEQFIL